MRRVVALLVLTLVAALVGVAPAQAWKPRDGAYFNEPRASATREFAIERELVKMIDKAKKGSSIRITLFSFDRVPVAERLVAAKKRGVHVKILLNNHQWNRAMGVLRKGLGGKRGRNSYMYVCSNGCRSGGENLHSKMFLFSHTGKAKNVVVTGSVNFTLNGVVNQFNDALVRSGDEKLFKAFRELYGRMRRDKRDKPLWFERKVGRRFDLMATPYLRASPTNDPVITAFKNVKCRGAGANTYTSGGRTKIRVSMHSWSGARGTWLAKRMRQLANQGCDVKVMYGWGGASVRDVFAARGAQGKFLSVHTNGYDTNNDRIIDLYSHHKYFFISGNVGKDRNANVVYTGSSNWENAGVNGDEIILRIANAKKLVRQYQANFDYIWRNRSHAIRYQNPRMANGRLAFPRSTDNLAEPQLLRGGPAWEND